MKRLFPLFLLLLLALLAACQSTVVEPAATGTAAAPTVAATETVAPPATENAAAPTETAPAATAEPAASPTTEMLAASGALCPEISRPALGLAVPSEGHLIINPFSGERCQPGLSEEAGLYQARGGSIFYTARENEQFVIKQLGAEGEQSLSFTAVPVEEAVAFHSFIVSPDGTTLAWAAGAPDGADSANTASQMWVGETTTGDAWTPLPPFVSEDPNGFRRIMVPIRFSADNSILYYSLQPYGIGGMWNAFVGRYDNLYALRLKSEAPPELLFDCTPLGVTLCLGDFVVSDNQVTGLAYVNQANKLIIKGAGELFNTVEVDLPYVAYPTWGPSSDSELLFYAADVQDTAGPPLPATAGIYRIPPTMGPTTVPAELLLSDPNLLPPQAWLDDSHLVVGYALGDSWSVAVVDVNGGLNVVEDLPNASFVTVLP